MEEKKRKRKESEGSAQSKKRQAIERPSQSIKVSHVKTERWAPVLASTPGLSLPNNISFQTYKKSHENKKSHELLLHSSQHPRVDYTAREEASNGIDSHLKHYIGIYDPKLKELKIIAAKKLVTRSALRHDDSEDESSKVEAPAVTGYAARNKLGLAFGTKKSKKAIKNLTVNAINASPANPKPNADGEDQPKKLDALSEAVLSSMPATSSMPTRDELQAQVDKGKPIPTPHLDATNPSDVYPVAELVGGEHVLRKIQVKDWIDKLKAGGDVQVNVNFVAQRLVANVGNVLKMRVLRYLCMIIAWWGCLKPGKMWKVPEIGDKSMQHLGEYGTDLIEGLKTRFSRDENGFLTKWHRDRVLAHIFALTLVVDDFKSDTFHIRTDLRVETRELKSLFKELGCPLRNPTDSELKQLNMKKSDAALHQFAQLKLPLTFPKSRLPAARRR